MRYLFLIICVFVFYMTKGQTKPPSANIRLSFLIFPFTPLLTVEVKTIGNLTLQFESNFVNTHGVNLKYFLKNRMDGHYVFTGVALIENKLLRKDEQITFLPYAGYGYAYRFGNRKHCIFDNRIGIGSTTNADNNSIYPVIKTGVGYTF
ncbi:hypothetical protein AD998_21065 [bacterium 336/3]|nr:hypothetical protein AD998_21065 [bacterium 336/3]